MMKATSTPRIENVIHRNNSVLHVRHEFRTIPCYSLQTNNVITITVDENLSALRKILTSMYLIQRRAYKSSCSVTSPAWQNAKIEI